MCLPLVGRSASTARIRRLENVVTTAMVVLDSWPVRDVGPAAATLVACAGGTATDRARQLNTCRGILAEGLTSAQADAMARALNQVGRVAWAAPTALVGVLPHPLTSRRIDARDSEVLEAGVSMTGPPVRISYARILALVPAVWTEVGCVAAAPVAKATTVAGAAVSLATTGGIGMLLKSKSKAAPAARKSTTAALPMVEIMAVGGIRIQAFAHRMDYSALGKAASRGEDNWRALIALLRARARPAVVGGELVDAWLQDGLLPAWLQSSDNNDLGRSVRWLMLRSALRRLAARGD